MLLLFTLVLRWNEALIAKVLPLVYERHLLDMIERGILREIVYKAYPVIENVAANWRSFLQVKLSYPNSEIRILKHVHACMGICFVFHCLD